MVGANNKACIATLMVFVHDGFIFGKKRIGKLRISTNSSNSDIGALPPLPESLTIAPPPRAEPKKETSKYL